MASATTITTAVVTAATSTGARYAKNLFDLKRNRGVSLLMYACQQGDVDRVRKIIRSEPHSVWDQDRTGKTALHYCCTSDHICAAQTADLLVMAAPDLVERHDEDGFTPLHLAVIAGNMPLVTFLLANHADVNGVDNEKHTVVHWATVCGETSALRAVLAAGAPVSTPDVHGGYPLHYAAQMCGGEKDPNLGLQVLQTLLTHSDIVVSVEDGDGRQPLLWAASAGSSKAVLALIRAGAQVEAPDRDGLTALHCAASRGHTDCIDTLLTLCGASPDVIDSNGCTALHYAVTLGHADATALLLAHGADPNRRDRKGRSPAHCGCAKGQFETVKMIGAHGANLWLRNARGDLPLHEAAASGRRELVKWLLEMRPSQVNARNNDGRCPLHLAAMNDNSDMCKILLDAGAQINPILRTSKNNFMTPLDCALQRGFRATAKYLQLHGGMPANRLGSGQIGKLENEINFQVRDDVTFWGDTETDSENADNKISKRIQRKKKSQKLEKKPLISSNDPEISHLSESAKINNEKLERSSKVNPSLGTNTAAENSEPTDRIKQTNPNLYHVNHEIIINGKTEINIHHTKQITIEKALIDKKEEVLTVETEKNENSVEKEKKTRSTKHNESLAKAGRFSAKKSAKSKIEKNVDKVDNLAKVENNEVSDRKKLESVTIDKKDNNLLTSFVGPDQESIISNTSEDNEIHKNILVEASVHEPPKEDSKIDGETIEEDQEPVKTMSREQTIEISAEEVKNIQNKFNEKTIEATEAEVKNSQNNVEQSIKNDIETSITNQNNNDTVNDTKIGVEQTSQSGKQRDEAFVSDKDDLIIEENDKKSEIVLGDSKFDKDCTIDKPETQQQTSENYSDLNIIEKCPEIVTFDENQNVQEHEDQKCTNHTKPLASTEDKNKTSNEELISIENSKEKIASKSNEHLKNIEKTDSVTELADKTEKNKSRESMTKDEAPISVNKDEPSKSNESFETEPKGLLTTPNEGGIKVIEDSAECNKKINVPKETSKLSKRQRKKWDKRKAYKPIDDKSAEKELKKENGHDKEIFDEEISTISTSSSSSSPKQHKSFRVLDDQGSINSQKNSLKKQRSRSEENETLKFKDKKRSKIPTPLAKTKLSKSDKYLNVSERKVKSSLETRVPSLPNIHDYDKGEKIKEKPRPDSNLSAPNLPSVYSDNEHGSGTDLEDEEQKRNSALRKRKVKRRSKNRDAVSAGSDYESSNIIDSGFEPSPRSTKIPRSRNISERNVNMISVTQSIQSNIRRYHLERKIFQQLLELKRMQIRAGQHNEAILVKRAIDSYHNSCVATVGAGRYIPKDYTFKSFEKFLYTSLRKLQRHGVDYMKNLPESPVNPLLCTKSTNRCMHATHAYTGIPCAAYLPMMDHHTIPKIGFNSTNRKADSSYLPNINQKKAVTLELCHGTEKQVISLPTERLDRNKRYYVTFTVKGSDETNQEDSGHAHPKSD